MKKTLSLFLVIVLLVTSSFSFSAVATEPPTVRYLDVTRQTQEKTNWCWAACSSMISHYFWPSSYYSQKQIVQYVKGASLPNATTVPSETIKALKYALKGKYNDVTYTIRASYDFVVDKIAGGKPLIFVIGWNGGGAHDYVATGVNSLTNNVRMINPAVGRGTVQYTYSSLMNGTTLDSGTGSLIRVYYY